MKGRKRHLVVDTLGLLLAVAVHPADLQSLPRATTRGPRRRAAWYYSDCWAASLGCN